MGSLIEISCSFIIITGISTLKLAKRIYPKAEDGNHRQENLVQKLLGEIYSAHNALADVVVLQKLFNEKLKSKCNCDDVFRLCYYSCKSPLGPLVKLKVISVTSMKKLIGLSLDLAKLKVIHARDPNNGIRNVFSDHLANFNKCRASKSNTVIGKLVNYHNQL